MFKKIILSAAVMFFASGVLLASIWKTSAQSLQKNISPATGSIKGDGVIIDETENEESQDQEAAGRQIEYDLPYPGILPGHFLYPIKMIRDKIWLFLTTDVLKKAELLLKFADKRILAAQMLAEEDKDDLAVTTASKAEKYLERAVGQEKTAREKGVETTAFLEKLSLSALKHEEILINMKGRIGKDSSEALNVFIGQAQKKHEEVTGAMGN